MKVEIIRSSTWLTDNFEDISRTLDETIEDLVPDDYRIINIQVATDFHGSSRFWIYLTKVC